MPLPKVHKHVQDQNGNIVPEVLGSVYNHGTGVLATLYQDDAGTTPLGNPMTSDAQYGSFQFYIDPGHYDMTFTKPGYTFQTIYDMQVVEDVLTLGTMATQNANAVAITGGTATLANLGVTGSTRLDGGVGLDGASNPAFSLVATKPVSLQNTLGVGGQTTLQAPVGIQAAPNAAVAWTLRHAKATQYGGLLQATDTDAGSATILFRNVAGGDVGSITTSATATAFNTSSDVRLKHAVQALTGALAAIQALRPVTFRWNADDSADEGFLAHELQQVLPHAVTGEPDAINDDGSVKPQQVEHSKLVPWLTAALQETLAQVEALTSRVTQLEEALGL